MKSPNQMIRFGGHLLMLDAAGALWWPEQRVLVVSDMHLEKSTYLALHGSFIPPYDTQDTLDRLEQLIRHYQPSELILLGDSFHDRNAWARLDPSIRERISLISTSMERCVWLEGNHDVQLVGHALNVVASRRELDGLLFSHELAISPLPQIIGHFHPKVTVNTPARKVRGPCFVQTSNLLIMPSFGSYTGGLDVRHEALAALAGGERRQFYLLHGQSILKLPQ